MRNNPSRAIHPTVFLLLWLVASFGLSRLWPVPIAFRVPEVVAVPLFLMGAVLIVWSIVEFGRHGTPTDHDRPTTALITRGPFRLSRNPIYVGLMAILLASSIRQPYVWPWAMTLGFGLAVHFLTVKPEEAYLAREFGEDYRAYRESVRRWV